MLPVHILRRFLYLSLFILTAACNLLTSSVDPTAEPEVTLSPTLADIFTSSGLGDTVEYTDDVIGFTFSYPAGWHILDSVPGQLVLISTLPISEPGTKETSEGIPEGESKIDFIVMPEGSTLESVATQQAQQENVTVTLQENLTLPSGLRAIRLELDTQRIGHVPILLIEVNGRIVLAVNYGTQGAFYDIAGNMRLRA